MFVYHLFSISPHLFVQQFTPPVPLGLCLIASGLVICVSFVIVGLFARNGNTYASYPRFNVSRSKMGKMIPWFGLTTVAKSSSVLIFFLVLSAGIIGNPNPIYNIGPTMIWVIWWVGIAYISAFVCDVWSILNPWKILFEWVEVVGRKLDLNLVGKPIFKYPRGFGKWPAFILLLVFAWIENVYSDAIVPVRISQMILIYSGITWVGMFVYGKNVWIRNGEVFSLAFGLLARFAPIGTPSSTTYSADVFPEPPRLEFAQDENSNISSDDGGTCNSRDVVIRPFGSGLLNMDVGSATQTFFILVLLASVTFDGFTATVLWMDIQTLLSEYLPNSTVISSLGLAVSITLFIATYLAFSLLTKMASSVDITTMDIANMFVNTLIPIALAYHVAHFLIFLLIQGQLIIPLSSDPFGFGWDIFGTANYRLNFGFVGSTFYWSTSVIAIVIGHIIAVFLSHSIALRLKQTHSEAIRSQYPMLLLMVGYTVASLWILTQPMYA